MLAELMMIIMAVFVVGFLGTRLAKVFRIPHSVFLVVLGIAAGLILRILHPESVNELSDSFPEIILFILLPPLIFESAYNFDISDLKKDFLPISTMAVVSLLLSTLIIGFSLHYLLDLQLIPSLTFGVLISATDPVAVVALFKEVGAPKRLNALVEGESLLNDGTAIVLYKVLLGLVAAPVFQPSMLTDGIVQFFVVALGGTLVGWAVYYLISLILKVVTDSAAQLGLTVAGAFLSFLIADHVFHVSGVISTMMVGLLLGNKARLELNKEALHGMHYIWEFLALAANTVVFLAVGLSIDPMGFVSSLYFILPTLGFVYFARSIGVFGVVPLLNKTPWMKPISIEYQTVLVWGGLRGGLALALVLLLPENFPHKQLFLSLASSVVLATLFINALTIERMMGWFKLGELTSFEKRSYLKTLNQVIKKALVTFAKAASSGQYSSDVVDQQKHSLLHLLESKTDSIEEEDLALFNLQEALVTALVREQAYYNHQVEEGLLSKKAYSLLSIMVKERRGLSFQELENYKFLQIQQIEGGLLSKLQSTKTKLSLKMEVLLNLKFAVEDSRKEIKVDSVLMLQSSWIKMTEKSLENFYSIYPDQTASLQTRYLSSLVTHSAEIMVEDLQKLQIVSSPIAIRLKKDLEEVHEHRMKEAQSLLKPSLGYLIQRVPLFKSAPSELVGHIIEKATTRSFNEGEEIVKEGATGESFFLVTSGLMEVSSEKLRDLELIPRLFIGDFFGEMSLLFSKPRSATVRAVVSSEAIEISKSVFDEIMTSYPEIREGIVSIAEKRAQ